MYIYMNIYIHTQYGIDSSSYEVNGDKLSKNKEGLIFYQFRQFILYLAYTIHMLIYDIPRK